jgi:transcriptional adapter 3
MKKARSESFDHQLEPMPAEIVYEPLEDDPTIYEIEEVTPDMSIEDRKRIYRVASFPTIDLSPQQPGIPPDEDFSKGKAPNQVSLNAFHNMIEPYFRLFNEEDEAFLRERVSALFRNPFNPLKVVQGDRVQPFIMPALGKHYKKVWAEEDGTSFAAFERPSPSPNEPRGSPERLNDNALESEDISVGPLMARVLAAMIPEEQEAKVEEAKPKDRDTPMTNGIITNGDSAPNGESSATLTVSSSTNLTPVASEATVKAQPVQKTDYAALEQRLLQEMKYIGLIPLNAPEPDWNERQDDEVSARLRLLQKQLHKTAVGVGAMKARLAELLEPEIAYQEYSTIHDDLDRQLETAYSKRTRTIKAKKKKVGHHLANGANAAGVAQSRIGIGDVAKSIMEKRTKWHNEVGPVFDADMRKLPKDSMFQDIDEYVKLEEEMFRAAMEEAQEAEADG